MILFVSAAEAFECGYTPPGCDACELTYVPLNEFTYRVVNDIGWTNFDALGEGEIESAAEAWSSIDGSSWTFIRGADTTAADVSVGVLTALQNGDNEIALMSEALWTSRAFPTDALGVAIRKFSNVGGMCVVTGADVYIRDTGHLTYHLPSFYDSSDLEHSLGQVLLHEFGHVTGFGHENDAITLMNSFYPLGGDPGYGASYEVWPDEADAMADVYPGSTSHEDYFLFRWERTGPGTAREVWDPDSVANPLVGAGPERWEQCPGEYVSSATWLPGYNFPAPLLLGGHVQAAATVTVEWRLAAPTESCEAATRLLAGPEDFVVYPGLLTEVQAHANPFWPNDEMWCVPADAGYDSTWNVCAVITTPDADAQDNTVRSEVPFVVPPRAACCGGPHYSACPGDAVLVCN